MGELAMQIKRENAQIEVRLGGMALNGLPFKVRLPALGVYAPHYEINPVELIEGAIIGHVVMLLGNHSLVISRITKIHYDSDEFSVIDWPSHLTTEPILHNWDTRTVDELLVSSLFLDLNSIQCILREICPISS